MILARSGTDYVTPGSDCGFRLDLAGVLRMERSGMDLTAELEQLRRKNEELELRVQGLTWDCEDLKHIISAHGHGERSRSQLKTVTFSVRR